MKTILVVDDEASIRQVMSLILESEGYRVVTAENGREGLEQLAESGADLVLCDLMMPEVSGLEMYDKMLNDPLLREVPVLLMSAAWEPEAVSAQSYSGFLRKPFNVDTLLDGVARALGETIPNREQAYQ